MNHGRLSENIFSDEKEAGRGSQVCPLVGSISRIDRKKLKADLTPFLLKDLKFFVVMISV